MSTTERLIEALEDQIAYFAQEYEMTNAEAVGCLEIVKHNLIRRMLDEAADDDSSPE